MTKFIDPMVKTN